MSSVVKKDHKGKGKEIADFSNVLIPAPPSKSIQ